EFYRRARGVVDGAVGQLVRTGPRVRAAQILVAFLLLTEFGPAGGAAGGHDEFGLAAVAKRCDRAEDFGDDVTGLAEGDGVADDHALAFDFVAVVQCGTLNGGAGDGDLFHDGEESHPSGPTDLDMDVDELRRHLLGRVFERRRPPRRT